jgi:P4 family phage/plasmid primase-like protien
MANPTVRFTKFHGEGIAKSYSVVAGAVQKSSAPSFSVGTFETIEVRDVVELRTFIDTLVPGDFLTAGVHKTSTSGLCGPGKADIRRKKETFPFALGEPGLLIIDADNLDKMGLADINGFAAALSDLVGNADFVLSPSSSSGITHDGVVGRTKGIHALLFVEDAASIPDTLETLHKRSVLLGNSWPLVTESGSILIRSLVDTAMKTSNQPCFEGGAILADGIAQDRKIQATKPLESMMFVRVEPLTADEEVAYHLAVKTLTATVSEAAEEQRSQWRLARGETLMQKGHTPEQINRVLDSALAGDRPVLDGDFEIMTDHHGILTVREILADRVKYHGETCHDPIDWDYGRGKAKIYSNNAASPAIHSFAHGEKTYILKQEIVFFSTSNAAATPNIDASITLSGAALDKEDRTDAGNVAVFADVSAGNLRFVLERKQWICWTDGRWQVDHGNQNTHQLSLLVAEHYQALANDIRNAAKQPALSAEEIKKLEATAKSLENWCRQCRNKPRLDAMLGLAQRDHRFVIQANQLDQNPWIMGVFNGVVDLTSGQLRPDSRSDFVTKRSPVSFNPKATAPRWQRFILEISAQPDGISNGKVKSKERRHLATYIQKALGYSCTAIVREHVMFIAVGAGSNGKNVLLDTIKSILGDYAETIAPEVLMAAKFENSAEQASPSTRKLAGARVAFSSESKEGQCLDVALIKRHTGGGFITARGLHENPITFEITHKLWLMTNHTPRLDHMDEATKGRLHLIPFDMKWNRPGEVRPNPTLPDAQKDLMEVLAKEEEGILLWLIQGAVEYAKTGLQFAQEVQAFTQNYLDSQDGLSSWLEDYDTCEPAEGTTAGDLMEKLRIYCHNEDMTTPVTTAAQLGRRLTALGHKSVKVRDGKRYGLRRKEATDGARGDGLAALLKELTNIDTPTDSPDLGSVTV